MLLSIVVCARIDYNVFHADLQQPLASLQIFLQDKPIRSFKYEKNRIPLYQSRETNLHAVCVSYVCLLRFLIVLEILVFKLDGYYENMNFPLDLPLLLYFVIFLVLLVVFRGHKICISAYDEQTLTYYNTLLRKSKSLDLSTVKMAVFDTFGVKFYDHQDADYENEKPMFFLPFFRDGIIEALDIDAFFKMMKAREGVQVIKTFKVLPGYTRKWTALTVFYGFLAVFAFMNTATPLTVVIVLLQNH